LTASNVFRVELESNAESPACRAVCELLREHNLRANPGFMELLSSPTSKTLLNLVARSDERVVGGLLGYTERKWLRIDIMAVAADYQRRGIGTSLLRRAEKIAVSRGCCYAFVDSLEHQAPGFYFRCGYVESGVIADWDSHGTSKYFLTRQLESK